MIILSFIEMIGHFTQYTLLHFFRFDPLIEYFLQNSPPPILFTIIFDILGCSFVAQGCYYLLIAIMRYIAITFTTEKKKIIGKIIYPSHVFIIFVSSIQILFAPIYYGNYILDTVGMLYTRNIFLGTFNAKSLFINTKNRLIYSTTLSTITTMLSIIINILLLIKFQKNLKKSTSKRNDSTRKSERKLNIYVSVLSIKQFLYFILIFTQTIRPKINNDDDSIYQILQGLRPFVMHLNFFVNPIAFIYLNSSVQTVILSFFKKKSIKQNSTTHGGSIKNAPIRRITKI
uniref:G-protein coupled receptors family 1 profile domain-containing protein n=1 Tax=Strongyloides stercoralis TaxID=6248 RepID=A0AAF5DFK2_STRER